jgi:hypothetical protein
MMRPSSWTDKHDAELVRLAQMGYSVVRLELYFKKNRVFIAKRAKTLGIQIRKPSRLPEGERV